MKHIILLLLLCSCTAQAQDPEFWIGSWGVAPQWDATIRNVWPVRGMLNPLILPNPDNGAEARTLLNCLSDSILPRAHWLGLNLVGFTVRAYEGLQNLNQGDHVIPDSNFWNNNAVDEVCRSADAHDLQVLVRDEQLSRRFMGERIMLHPESADDFGTHGDFDPFTQQLFNEHILYPNPFATTLRQRDGGPNCIYMSGNSGTISGMTLARLLEMSAYRTGDSEDPNRLSGMYQVSAIVLPRYDTGYPLPNDDATHVLNVRFRYTHPITGATVYLNCPLEGRQLWEGDQGARTLRTGVQEIIIGAIEVQQTDGRSGGDVIFVDQGDLVNHGGWVRTGMEDVRGPRRLSKHGWFHLQEIRGDFDVQIFYGDDDVHLWLDAVCLTNPATFGLWNPGNPGTLAEHTGYRTVMENRMAFLLRNNDPALEGVGGIPGLRFVMGEEQVFNNGTYWTTFLLSRLIADETDDHVQLFSTYGSWTNTELTPILAAEMITGPYNYPLLTDHPRPTLQGMTA